MQNSAVGTPAPSPEAAPGGGGGDGPAPAGRIHFLYFLGADLGVDPAHPSVSQANSPTQGVLPAGEGLAWALRGLLSEEGPEPASAREEVSVFQVPAVSLLASWGESHPRSENLNLK